MSMSPLPEMYNFTYMKIIWWFIAIIIAFILGSIIWSPNTSTTAPIMPTDIVYPVEDVKQIIPTESSSIFDNQPIIKNEQSGGGYICNCSKTCPNLSCDEAQYQLNSCGCSQRDGDRDGVACDRQCQ